MKNLFEPATVNEIRADGTSQAGQRTAVGQNECGADAGARLRLRLTKSSMKRKERP
jgi:hypothetical protein